MQLFYYLLLFVSQKGSETAFLTAFISQMCFVIRVEIGGYGSNLSPIPVQVQSHDTRSCSVAVF